jgi:hypothetical protein
MSMINTHSEIQTPPPTGTLRFAFSVLATAALTLLLVPAAALGISYLAGGAATSTILLVYVFALFTNGPFLLAGLAITAGAVAMPRLVSNLYHSGHHHGHA